MCPLLVGEHPCPVRAFFGHDGQSSFEAASCLCSSSIPDSWDSPGLVIWVYQTCCCTGVWHAARIMDPMDVFENACSSYYHLLFEAKDAKAQYGRHWQKHTFSETTLRTLLSISGHVMIRIPNWPKDVSFDLSRTMSEAMLTLHRACRFYVARIMFFHNYLWHETILGHILSKVRALVEVLNVL